MTAAARTRRLVSLVAATGTLMGCSVQAMVPMATGSVVRPDDLALPAAASLVVPNEVAARPLATVKTTETPAQNEDTGVDTVAAADVIDAGPKGLTSGSKGAAVVALENRLTELRFNPGRADGAYDNQLAMAVMGFQKQQDLPRTGRADLTTLARLGTAGLGGPMVATAEGTRVEIDLKRQIAQFWKDGRLARVIAVSTGNGAYYCVPKDKGGGCDTAITPGGAFRADRKIKGQRVSALGTLYDPVYFYGGIALHGSPSVPATPASHGCVRVPMWESGWVHSAINVGDPVYVVGGKTAPVPFGETAPVENPDEVTVPSTVVDADPRLIG